MTNHVRDTENPHSMLHVVSAVLLTVVDNAFWGVNAMTLGLATPLVMLLAFSSMFLVVILIQVFMAKDGLGLAITKGVIVGILAGVPTSVVGTFAGGFILGDGIRARRVSV